MDEHRVDEKIYKVESSGFRISGFLDMVIGDMGLELSFELLEGQHLHPDLEDPDILVKFSGPDVDMLLAPSRLSIATKVTDPLDGSGGGPEPARPKSRGLNGIIPAGNLAGLPAISLPCGFANNLPIGISLVARPLHENLLISAGKAFQAKTDWHKRNPRVE